MINNFKKNEENFTSESPETRSVSGLFRRDFLKDRKSGFTLVEMIMYLSLMAIITLVIVQSLVAVLKSNRGAFADINLRNAGYSAMEGMLREIYSSDSVTLASDELQMTQGTNIVKFATSTSATTTLYFYEGVGTPVSVGPLTSKGITVKSLIFTKINTGKSQAVRIQMKLETTVNNITKSEWFYSTGILRGSY
jgi:type II secretory pathway pseudopilin PulG